MAQRIRGRRVPIMEIVGKNGRMAVRNRIIPADGMALNEGPDGTSFLVQPPDGADGEIGVVTATVTGRVGSTFAFTLGQGTAALGKKNGDNVENSGTGARVYNFRLAPIAVGKLVAIQYYLGIRVAVPIDC